MIRKKDAAKEQLRDHLLPKARVTTWIWVASDNVGVPAIDKLHLRLAKHGITFAGRKVLPRHLPGER